MYDDDDLNTLHGILSLTIRLLDYGRPKEALLVLADAKSFIEEIWDVA